MTNGIHWRELSGAEVTWLLYQQEIEGMKSQASKRKFMHAAEDWQGLRLLDAGAFDESDLGTGGLNG